MIPILVAFHCGSNAGFAIERLEQVFLAMARKVAGSDKHIHFSYRNLARGQPKALPNPGPSVTTIDPFSTDKEHLKSIEDYVRRNNIKVAFGFDQQPGLPLFGALRRGGVRKIVSYWGAPMSGLNTGLKLWLKRLEVMLNRGGPDHYVFESEAMRDTGVRGRGVSATKSSVVHLAVDPLVFFPAKSEDHYAHSALGIPSHRKIVYYSGHMEPRKGVDIIVRAAVTLVDRIGVDDVHFVFCGNRDQEADRFLPLYIGTKASEHITFAGYRTDVAELMRSATLGTIASTGWDSFTMSAVELAASGVPLVVSNLQGLAETIVADVTGLTFTPGNHEELAHALHSLLQDEGRRRAMSLASRERALQQFTIERQVEALVRVCLDQQ